MSILGALGQGFCTRSTLSPCLASRFREAYSVLTPDRDEELHTYYTPVIGLELY